MPPTLQASDGALADAHDVALLDLDGVVYIGPDAVPGVPEALARARRSGLRLAFVTNNAARPPRVVADHLTRIGVQAAPEEVITSSQAAARYLADRLPGGARVLVIGTVGLQEALRERGLTPVDTATGGVDAVVQGYSPTLDWTMLAEGAVALNSGVLWVATNADPTVPSPRGPLPGNGSTVAALAHATGRTPVVTGKPDPTMHRETLLRTEAERPLVVGDRLDTDIEGANAVGCPSLLVFSGVTTPADLLAAPPEHRPTYLASDLRGVLDRHPAPARRGEHWTCGAWVASVQDGAVVLDAEGTADDAPGTRTAGTRTAGDGEPALDTDALDALRALAAASWARRDDGDAKAPVTVRAGGSESGRAQQMLRTLRLAQ